MTSTPPGAGPLSLAVSPCPNDTFVFHALVHGLVAGAPDVSVELADIERCNTLAVAGAADLVKVSYAALPELLDRYRLLPTGGALGRGCGPLVLARDAGQSLRGAVVAVPGARTTAYLLFRLWAAAAGVGRVVQLTFDEIMPAVRDGLVDAGLVIHESRFTYPGFGLVPLADLGAWWEDTTGLPIPLGAIVARRTLDTDALTAAVRASVEAAWADPGASATWVAEHAQELAPEVQAAHIALYVNEFTRDLGVEGLAAVRTLLERAAAAGLVRPTPAAALT